LGEEPMPLTIECHDFACELWLQWLEGKRERQG
jgi:hypothetical protein